MRKRARWLNFQLHWKIPHPILVTAHTNVAVDNLLAGLRAHGVKATRVGNVERIRADLREHAFDIIAEGHPLAPEVDALQEDLAALWRKDPATGDLSSAIHRA
jgi:hypothetical protein